MMVVFGERRHLPMMEDGKMKPWLWFSLPKAFSWIG